MARTRASAGRAADRPEATDLVERIRHQADTFSASYGRVADYVVAHLTDVAFYPAARVAQEAGVSESVVIRFATSLGYAGYPDMQQASQAFVRAQSAPSTRFESLAITNTSTPEEILRAVLTQDANNLSETLADPTMHGFGAAVEMLTAARRVYVAGFRGLSFPAGLAAFLLDMTGIETILLGHGDAVDFQLARRMGEGDVFLTFAFVRYTRRTLELVRLARGRGAGTLVIADSVTAPAARAADHVLRLAVRSPGFYNSYAAAVGIVNALIMSVSVKARERVARSLKDIDAVMPVGEFDIA